MSRSGKMSAGCTQPTAAENLVVVRHIALNLLRSVKGVNGGIASRRMQSAYDDTVREKVLCAGLN